MFERFTTQARSVVMLAQQEARELGHPNLGTHLLLLAILGEPETAGGRALSALGIGADDVREEIVRYDRERSGLLRGGRGRPAERRRRSGPGPAQGRGGLRARRARAEANRAAVASQLATCPSRLAARRRSSWRSARPSTSATSHIGTEHLLLGLVRDEDCSAAKLLAARGVDRERVRAEVLRQIAAGGDQSGRTA